MSSKSKATTPPKPRRYPLPGNYHYALTRLLRIQGTQSLFLGGMDIILKILLPFASMALPSVVVYCLTGKNEPLHILLALTGYVAGLQVLRLIQNFFHMRHWNNLFLFRVKLQHELFAKNLQVSYQFLESARGQEKMNHALSNLYSGNDYGIEAFLRALSDLLVNLGGLLVYAAVIGQKKPLFLFLLLLLTAIVAWGNYLAGENSYRFLKTQQKLWQEFNYLRRESIKPQNGKDIRMYRLKSWFLRAFDANIQKHVSTNSKIQNGYLAAGILEKLLSFARDGILYGYLIVQMRNGQISLSGFLLYIGIVAAFGTWMTGLFGAVQQMLQQNVTMNLYRDYMDSGNVDDSGKAPLAAPGAVHEIRLEHVSFRYDGSDRDALTDLNLTIHTGEKLALVGENGAGKTTLIKLICGLYRPSSGRIFLDGQDISTLSLSDYFREFSVVFQDCFAFSFPLEDNVSCADPAHTNARRLQEVLEKAGLWERIRQLPDGTKTMLNKDLSENGVVLSGGELQKLMLARALYKDAPILILDEPTAALDPIAESQMYEKYHALTSSKTSIFISHRLSSTRFCDRILFLENGAVTEEGSHQSLMEQNGSYARMFTIQAHYYQKEMKERACCE